MLAQSINVAFAVGLAFAIAASCNFPVLLMSMFSKDMTTRSAVVGGFLGLVTAFFGVVLSPAVWEGIFGNPKGSALIRLDNPTLFSMSLAFIGIYVVSKLDTSVRAATVRAGFDAANRHRRGRRSCALNANATLRGVRLARSASGGRPFHCAPSFLRRRQSTPERGA